jgi:outer membrane protein OmpA-like peptidoglycan-associated protein
MEEVMGKALTLRYPWNSLATVLLAVAFFMPAKELVAQMPAAGASSQAQEFTQNVKEVYFPFNIYNRIVDPSVLNSDADWLKQHPDAHFWIQGYADARGDIFYNLVLSYRRAQFIKSSLVQRGVSQSQIGYATGWGKLYPLCSQDDADCFQKNRRGDIVPPDLM